MTALLSPFLVPSFGNDGAIRPGAWFRADDPAETPVEGSLKGWDYGVDLRFSRTIHIDIPRLRSEAGLGADAEARLTVTWHTERGYASGERAFRAEIPLSGSSATTVQPFVDVTGSRLAGDVVLTTHLVLSVPGQKSVAMAPRRPGSVLWTDSTVVSLEGTGARVPIVVVDFREMFAPFEADAAWTVQISTDWKELHPSVAFQVLLNSRRESMVAALRNPQPGEHERAMRSMLFFDVGRQLIRHSLADEDFGLDARYPDDSLGSSMIRRIKSLFPNKTVEEIRSWAAHEADSFERYLQSSHRLMKGTRE